VFIFFIVVFLRDRVGYGCDTSLSSGNVPVKDLAATSQRPLCIPIILNKIK